MTISFWREKSFNVQKSAQSNSEIYDLGALKAGVVVRIPVWLASWLDRREFKRKEREEIDQEMLVQAYRGE